MPIISIVVYSTLALFVGFLMDLLLGDPRGFPHIVRGMGLMIEKMENIFYLVPNKRFGGFLLVFSMVILCTILPAVILYFALTFSPWLYFFLETFLCWQLLAVKGLMTESNKVYIAINEGDKEEYRRAVSMIVGRDTSDLDQDGVIRATVETVAESISDGVVAPLFYIALGGAPLGCFYKAINTMDSMVGYKNERYLDYGYFAAKLDDIVNFIPSRLSAVLMIIATCLCRMNVRNAIKIFRRDRLNHASPNAGQTEAVMAGALDIRLAGDSYYFGKLYKKPSIGDNLRPVEPQDIRRSHKLLYVTAILMLILTLVERGVLYGTI